MFVISYLSGFRFFNTRNSVGRKVQQIVIGCLLVHEPGRASTTSIIMRGKDLFAPWNVNECPSW